MINDLPENLNRINSQVNMLHGRVNKTKIRYVALYLLCLLLVVTFMIVSIFKPIWIAELLIALALAGSAYFVHTCIVMAINELTVDKKNR